jgi:hypothetical protein
MLSTGVAPRNVKERILLRLEISTAKMFSQIFLDELHTGGNLHQRRGNSLELISPILAKR